LFGNYLVGIWALRKGTFDREKKRYEKRKQPCKVWRREEIFKIGRN
jgi:hypothetical protein